MSSSWPSNSATLRRLAPGSSNRPRPTPWPATAACGRCTSAVRSPKRRPPPGPVSTRVPEAARRISGPPTARSPACHVQCGQLDQAEVALSIIDHLREDERGHLPFLLDTRSQLRLAQMRPEEALEDALEAGRCAGPLSPGALAWRSTAALAHLALGDAEAARELAAEELELARRLEITRVVVRDLRVLGLSERGATAIKRLREAVQVAERYQPRLEYIHALIDLGGALRRANQRTAAREPLRKALELSHRGGARRAGTARPLRAHRRGRPAPPGDAERRRVAHPERAPRWRAGRPRPDHPPDRRERSTSPRRRSSSTCATSTRSSTSAPASELADALAPADQP